MRLAFLSAIFQSFTLCSLLLMDRKCPMNSSVRLDSNLEDRLVLERELERWASQRSKVEISKFYQES